MYPAHATIDTAPSPGPIDRGGPARRACSSPEPRSGAQARPARKRTPAPAIRDAIRPKRGSPPPKSARGYHSEVEGIDGRGEGSADRTPPGARAEKSPDRTAIGASMRRRVFRGSAYRPPSFQGMPAETV